MDYSRFYRTQYNNLYNSRYGPSETYTDYELEDINQELQYTLLNQAIRSRLFDYASWIVLEFDVDLLEHFGLFGWDEIHLLNEPARSFVDLLFSQNLVANNPRGLTNLSNVDELSQNLNQDNF